MILVVTPYDLPKPRTDLDGTVMLPASKFGLDGLELRHHPLLRRQPPDDECSVAPSTSTVVREAEERERLGFSLITSLPVASGTSLPTPSMSN